MFLLLEKIPYRRDFVDSTIKMKPVVEINPEYRKVFEKIIGEIVKWKKIRFKNYNV